jgi:hypothetical protein
MMRLVNGVWIVDTIQSCSTENPSADITIPYCADLFRYEYLGGADTWRGRVIKGFMWLMDFWPLRHG